MPGQIQSVRVLDLHKGEITIGSMGVERLRGGKAPFNYQTVVDGCAMVVTCFQDGGLDVLIRYLSRAGIEYTTQ